MSPAWNVMRCIVERRAPTSMAPCRNIMARTCSSWIRVYGSLTDPCTSTATFIFYVTPGWLIGCFDSREEFSKIRPKGANLGTRHSHASGFLNGLSANTSTRGVSDEYHNPKTTIASAQRPSVNSQSAGDQTSAKIPTLLL